MTQAPGIASPPAEGGSPKTIPGLDMALGLRRLAGKADRYRKTLHQFAKTTGRTRKDLTAAIDVGDVITAGRIAHNLKCAAGTIGAAALQAKVAALEELLLGNAGAGAIRTSTEAAMGALDALLAGLHEELAAA